MAVQAEEAFIRIALREKRLTQEQVEECRRIHDELSEAGIKWSLPQVVQERGLLSRKEIRRILKAGQDESIDVKINGYEIIRRVGRGGMGAVFMAKQVNMNRTVALKVLSQAAMSNTKFVERFQREAQIVASLRDKNIVAAFDYGESNGWHYMAMEFVEGLTVKKLVNRTGPLPEEQAVRIALDVASALKHAHAQNIIHRDVKPGNIMLDPDGVAKLCDLGMAKLSEGEDGSITRIGTTIGTPYYMSPEQARGETELDGRTDIYSLGTTLFYMLTGDVPFKDPSSAVVMAKHITADPPWLADVNSSLSDDISRVVAKMLAKNKQDRYANADELMHDLEAVLEGGPLIAPPRWVSKLEGPVPSGPVPPPKAAPGAVPVTTAQPPATTGVPNHVVVILAVGLMIAIVTILLLIQQKSDLRLQNEMLFTNSFAVAKEQAELNPADYERNIQRFEFLLRHAKGTGWEQQVKDHLDRARRRKEQDEAAAKSKKKP
ncbi:MAG: serine/threonine protein kinase [Planctomycetes bacterium]|nr:serine/threonine protein kinase [Planctomycetota bacterium]